MNSNFQILVATNEHIIFAKQIAEEMASSAKARGTGIAKRSAEYIASKISEGKAVISLDENSEWAGFCYIETWEHGKYVANSGLIIAPQYRHSGLARKVKKRIFELSHEKYPNSKIFGLTTGLAVMKINSDLGYVPVTYSELTNDDEFWKGCESCVNHPILMSKGRKNCLCTAMLFDATKPQIKKEEHGHISFLDYVRRSKFFKKFKLLQRMIFYFKCKWLKQLKRKLCLLLVADSIQLTAQCIYQKF